MLEREERAGAAHAALDLVEDQQRAAFVAEPARGAEETRRSAGCTPLSPCTGSTMNAAVPFVDRRVERGHVVEGREREAGGQRPKPS